MMVSTNAKPKKLQPPSKPNYDGISANGVKDKPSEEFTKNLPPIFEMRAQRQMALDQIALLQRGQIEGLIKSIEKERNSKVIVYFSRNLLNGSEVSNFYQLFNGVNKIQNLDLILESNGGIADDAFKMCRLCRQHTSERFGVLIPYRAKSAATLVALGADELVMGPASELGPVDPMIFITLQDGSRHLVPAHSIKDGLDFFESRIKAQPETALIYSQLLENLDPTVIGAYQRAIESSKQYAETLLSTGLLKKTPKKVAEVAKALGERYKSHSFVIDRDIARSEYGLNVIDAPDPVWNSLWQLYNILQVWWEDNPQIGSIIRTANSELVITRQENF